MEEMKTALVLVAVVGIIVVGGFGTIAILSCVFVILLAWPSSKRSRNQ
jgi:hypothetical protein